MSPDWQLAVAALAAAGAASVSSMPGRHSVAGSARRPRWGPQAWPSWLAPVRGAPGVRTRGLSAIGVALLIAVAANSGAGLGLAAVVGSITFVLAGRLRQSAVQRAETTLTQSVPMVCGLLAVSLEAGLPLRNAVAAVGEALDGPAGAALRRLDAAVRLGVAEADAWAELAEEHPAFGGLAGELNRTLGAGVALAPLLRQQAREARAAAQADAQARARRAGVSTVLPLVACFLPAFLLLGVVPIVGGVTSTLFG